MPRTADQREEISVLELSIIRWGEKILTPLLIAGFVAISSFLFNINSTVAELAKEHESFNENKDGVASALAKIHAKMDHQTEVQHKLEINAKRMETRQEHLKEDIDVLNKNVTEILKLLRDDRK